MRLKFREVNVTDVRDLYQWRNHPLVRKNSFNTKPLSFAQHQKWFQEKLKSRSTVIYIASDGERKIGSIRFESNSDCVQVNVMVNPEFIGKGMGAKLIEQGTKRFRRENKSGKPVLAEIKSDNTASIKAFQKAGYALKHSIYAFQK